jgi:hypothetical protein
LVDSDTSPSSLPSSTAYDGPPACTDRGRQSSRTRTRAPYTLRRES